MSNNEWQSLIKDEEIVRLLQIKDEMLDMYLEKLKQQNMDLIQAKTSLEALGRAKDALISNLGHEFRTPLTTIIGSCEILQVGELNPKQQKSIQIISSAAGILLDMINKLLDLAKIEEGALQVESAPISLSKLVLEVANLFLAKAHQKRLDFFFYFDPKLPQQMEGDSLRLKQILLNLLGNAFKFTNQGYIKLSIKKEEKEVLFEIEDSGIGITKLAQDKIFQKFFQVDVSITRNFGGTGLGLALCKQLVEIMKGTIGFSSEEGKGTLFWFKIPLQVKEIEEYKELKIKEIAIVSQKKELLKIIESYLNNWGISYYIVEKSTNVFEELRKASLVLWDLSFPVSNLEPLEAMHDKVVFVSTDDGVRHIPPSLANQPKLDRLFLPEDLKKLLSR